MSPYFKRGFFKTATPLLIEQSYDGNNSEHQEKRQSILESSYGDDAHDDLGALSKRQKASKKLVKEEAPFSANPTRMYLVERA